jgi:hypothetical protein
MKTQIIHPNGAHNSHRSHRSHASHSPPPSSRSPVVSSPVISAPSPLLLAPCSLLLALLLLPACTVPKPLRGGHATTAPRVGGIEQTLVQGENPSQPSKQHQETIKTRTYTIPAGTRFIPTTLSPTLSIPAEPPAAPDTQYALRNRSEGSPLQPSAFSPQPLLLSAPMPVTEREEVRAQSELGAAQKDTARDLAAKLSSLRGIVWVGLALFVFGLASLVWPPLKLIIGSVTTSAAIMAGGLALMVLPTLIVGNELLILGAVAVVVGCWFLAHRHGHLHGLVSSQSLPPSPSSQPSSQPLSSPTNPPIQ